MTVSWLGSKGERFVVIDKTSGISDGGLDTNDRGIVIIVARVQGKARKNSIGPLLIRQPAFTSYRPGLEFCLVRLRLNLP